MARDPRQRRIIEVKRLRQAGDLAGAEAVLDSSLAEDPGWAEGLCWRGALRLQARRWGAALVDLDACAQVSPEPGWHHQLRAEVRLALGEPDRALEDLAVAARWPHQQKVTHGLRGATLAVLGRWGEAFPVLEAALEAERGSRLALRLWGHLAAASEGVLGEIARSAEEEAARRPQLTWLPLLAGSAWLYVGRPSRAVALLTAAVAARPEDAYAHMNLGAALLNSGRPAEALPPLERAAALAPALARPLALLGEARLRVGRAEEARCDFEAAIERDRDGNLSRNWSDGLAFSAALAARRPEDAQSQLNHGRNLLNEDEPRRARVPLERAVALAPRWSVPRALLGEALLYTGRVWAALAAFRVARALEVDGELASVWEDAPAFTRYRRLFR